LVRARQVRAPGATDVQDCASDALDLVRQVSLDREEVLYVGDAPSDVKACQNCRIRIAAAAWAPTASIRELEEMHPDFVFTSVADFFDFLRRKLDPEALS
jgi:phosphoglycolate phosphatase-like HAD superfamily hydrolase